MRKRDIYLNLENLNGKDRKEVWDILKAEGELFWRKNSINNVLICEYNRAKEDFMWVNISNDYINTLGDRKEITLQQFKDLFKSYEISQEIEMRKEEIYLDLSKLSREEIKEVYKYLIENNQDLLFAFVGCVSNGNHFKSEKYLVFCRPSFCSWTCSKDFDNRYEINLQQFKDLFTFKGVTSQDVREEELFKDLIIGQEIEVNGFVLKVERKVSQWYVNKDTMKFIKSNYQPYGASLVTDKDFINQLEKFSK